MTTPNDNPRTVEAAAQQLSLSQSTIRAWISSGKIAYIKLGRSIRIPGAEIRRLLTDGYYPIRDAPEVQPEVKNDDMSTS